MNNKSSENHAVILQWGSGCFAGHSFKFEKRSWHFIGVHNEAPSVVAVCFNDSKTVLL
jgi:hypothetical protein